MRRSHIMPVSLVLLTALALVLSGCTQRDNPAIPETPAGGEVFQSVHQYDGLTNLTDAERSAFAARRVFTYLPEGYGTANVGRRFPVLYLLPGYDGEASFFYSYGNENYYLLANIEIVADRLVASGEIKPVIIVMPDVSIPYGGAFYGDSPLEGPWEDMMANELVTYIDATYRTLQENGKVSRAIGGHSSGGYGAMRLAMKYPELFNSVSAMDAPLALAGSGEFAGIQELFDDYLAESDINSEAEYLDADTLGFRHQPYKLLLYSMAATYSPSGVRDESTQFGKLQIGLPFDYLGNVIDTIWNKWMANDLYTMLDDAQYQANLSGQHIYFETSDHDGNFFNQQTVLFQQKLSTLGIGYTSSTYNGYAGYDADSRSFLQERLEFILKFHDQYLKDGEGNF